MPRKSKTYGIEKNIEEVIQHRKDTHEALCNKIQERLNAKK